MNTDLHSTLEKHYDAAAAAETSDQAPAQDATPAEDTTTDTTPAPVADSTPAPVVADKGDEPATDKPADKPADPASATDKPADTPAEPELKAPAGWSPIVREQWATLPADVKKEISRREDEMMRAFHQTTQDRKFAQEFSAITKKYEGALNGQTAAQAYESTLAYAQVLGGQDVNAKAKAIVSLIDEYGVDGEALAAALTGTPVQARPSAVEQENARLKAELQQVRAPQQQIDPVVKQAADDLQTFASKSEFFEDVKVTMGHLMSAASAQGFEMNLEQAYEQACRVVPSVKAVLERRTVNTKQQRAAAAVSVKSSPTGTTIKQTSNPNASLRDLLEANFDKYNS